MSILVFVVKILHMIAKRDISRPTLYRAFGEQNTISILSNSNLF
jgi:hypothetical protein